MAVLAPSLVSYPQLLRLGIDCFAVAALLGSMAFVSAIGNTWEAVAPRFLPGLVGYLLFSVSLFVGDRLYGLYKEGVSGWPS